MNKDKSQLIKKEQSLTKGFFLVEALFAVSILALLIAVFAGSYLYGQESFILSGERTRAGFVAEEGIEAVRNIRDADFANLTDGTYGLTLVNNEWALAGISDVVDVFTRQVVISTIDPNRKQIDSEVNWQQTLQRSGVLSLTAYLTNWGAISGGGPPVSTSCSEYCINSGYVDGRCRRNISACTSRGETNEPIGDQYCTVGVNVTCCCQP